jgi:hypothetical protein
MSKRESVIRRIEYGRRARLTPITVLLGISISAAAIVVGGAALAQRSPLVPGAVFEATHLPPLLVLPGEPVQLTYDVDCLAEGVDDAEARCEVAGSLYLRVKAGGDFEKLPLQQADAGGVRQLTAIVPDSFVAAAHGFEYYAELERVGTNDRLLVTPGGEAAPYRSRMLSNAIDVNIGAADFSAPRRGARVASARWGDGTASVGLEPGRSAGQLGASSFDVDEAGTVFVLDQVHRRVLRWAGGARLPARVPISVDGRLADLAVSDDGSLYILESVARPGRAGPLVRRFDETGRELDIVETAERSPSQIRMGPDGPMVLEHPSHQWTPMALDGYPLPPNEQRRRATSGRPLRSGGEAIVLRTGNELRIAVTSGDHIVRSWRLTSTTPLAEVQLAEAIGPRLVVVVRTFTESVDEFRVVVLDQHGIAQQFSVASADWAEAAPLSRFRLVGRSLYQLGSNAAGAFVDRYDLRVR